MSQKHQQVAEQEQPDQPRQDYEFQGSIDSSWATKDVLKTGIVAACLEALLITFFFIIRAGILDDTPLPPEVTPASTAHVLWTVVAWMQVPFVTFVVLSYVYSRVYGRLFQFEVYHDFIKINHGVFTKHDTTIAYSRVQNINIAEGVFDRLFGLATIKIETAGSSGASAQGSGQIRPEGYIPGLKHAEKVVKILKSQILRSSTPGSNLGDLDFTPQDVAFDNFVAYILTKMREGDELRNQIATHREAKGWSVDELAEKVGVRPDTIFQLEQGRYSPSLALAMKVARVLGSSLEDLFSMAGSS